MVKNKEEKNACQQCGSPIVEEEIFRHEEKSYCAKCAAEHIKDEHFYSSEAKRMQQFKSV